MSSLCLYNKGYRSIAVKIKSLIFPLEKLCGSLARSLLPTPFTPKSTSQAIQISFHMIGVIQC